MAATRRRGRATVLTTPDRLPADTDRLCGPAAGASWAGRARTSAQVAARRVAARAQEAEPWSCSLTDWTRGAIGVIAIAAVLVVAWLATVVARRRREAAMGAHATSQGWRPVEQTEEFGRLVANVFPELPEEAEQEARSARRRGGHRQGLMGSTIVIGGSGKTRSRTEARNVYLVPVEDGELAAGDLTIKASAGGVGQSRSNVHRGAVAVALPERLPEVKLVSRSRLDRESDPSMPDEVGSQFTAKDLGSEARAMYVESEAWRPLLDDTADVEGVAVQDSTLVLVSRKRLTPERTAALAQAATTFVAQAVGADGEPGTARARVASPLPAG